MQTRDDKMPFNDTTKKKEDVKAETKSYPWAKNPDEQLSHAPQQYDRSLHPMGMLRLLIEGFKVNGWHQALCTSDARSRTGEHVSARRIPSLLWV
ncbi:hypothetical protein NDU88_010304 [Pleurodeles waltl]|uniref:Uncharacterized protein n=1 Tax=Pleurodeles waltl TaxID=8319 RepID=A0AAV7QX40_PLEWA|nr:hypothetical protein NDU88_010304 [Pleurodeles waltl]